MKKFPISTAILAMTSTSALADGWTMGGGGGNGGTGPSPFMTTPITSTNTVDQSAVATPLNTTSTTVTSGSSGTAAYITSTLN